MESRRHQEAQRFRELDGTAKLKQTLDKAVAALYRAGIPHLVTGGYALQKYGCLRHTDNVDLVVPNIAQAVAALRVSGFQPHRLSQTIIVDPDTTFEVRLHAGGCVPSERGPAK